jgi:hypothetical protein
MSDAEVRRLRVDLDVMENAAGLRLPFGWPDVWLSLALVPSGVAVAAWTEFGPPGKAAWGLVPLLLVALVAAIRWSVRRRNLESKRPKRAAEVLMGLVVLAALPALVLWERVLNLPAGVARGAGFFSVWSHVRPARFLCPRPPPRSRCHSVPGPLRSRPPAPATGPVVRGRRCRRRGRRLRGSDDPGVATSGRGREPWGHQSTLTAWIPWSTAR